VKRVNLPILNRCKAVKTTFIEIKIAWIMGTFIELWFLWRQKMGWLRILGTFTFRIFDAESKTEFNSISAKTKNFGNICGVLILGLGTFAFWKKSDLKKSLWADFSWGYMYIVSWYFSSGDLLRNQIYHWPRSWTILLFALLDT